MKKFFTFLTIIGLVGVVGYGVYKVRSSAETFVAQNVSAPLTRLQQTEKLINELTDQRKKDQSFIDETNKQMESLKKSREAQARIDALMIVRTQLDVEITNLETTKK